MHTEKEIVEEIKAQVTNYWKYSHRHDENFKIFHHMMTRLNGLLWVLYDYSYKDICPYCGSIMECDIVDIGVGYQQCGPYFCEECHASEIHPNDDTSNLTEEEKVIGYYRNKISPMANTCCGILVDHNTAKVLYEVGCLDNCKPAEFKNECN